MERRTRGPTLVVEEGGRDAGRAGGRPVRIRRLATERLRRAVNVTLALLALVVTAPLMVVVAILIKATSTGPVLYTQPRVGADRRRRDPSTGHATGAGGKDDPDGPSPAPHEWGGGDLPVEVPVPSAGIRRDEEAPVESNGNGRRRVDVGGRIFTIYKFRTMRVGSDRDGQVWARPDDERITPVGRSLRKYHLDELPQLFNILKGDMNLVGPRPEQPAIFLELASQLPEYRRRQGVPPGLTGWAQIQHHYDRNLDDVRRKLELDLEYLERRSPLVDMKILARTVPAVLLGDVAKGW